MTYLLPVKLTPGEVFVHMVPSVLAIRSRGHTPSTHRRVMWFLTSRRRLLSLMVAPGGELSFLVSGLEDAGLVMCFLDVLS